MHLALGATGWAQRKHSQREQSHQGNAINLGRVRWMRAALCYSVLASFPHTVLLLRFRAVWQSWASPDCSHAAPASHGPQSLLWVRAGACSQRKTGSGFQSGTWYSYSSETHKKVTGAQQSKSTSSVAGRVRGAQGTAPPLATVQLATFTRALRSPVYI